MKRKLILDMIMDMSREKSQDTKKISSFSLRLTIVGQLKNEEHGHFSLRNLSGQQGILPTHELAMCFCEYRKN